MGDPKPVFGRIENKKEGEQQVTQSAAKQKKVKAAR